MKNYSISLVGFLAAKASTVQGVDPNRSSGQLANSISQFSSQECHLFMHAPCTLRLPVSISGDFPRGKRVSSLDSEPTWLRLRKTMQKPKMTEKISFFNSMRMHQHHYSDGVQTKKNPTLNHVITYNVSNMCTFLISKYELGTLVKSKLL